MQPVLAVGEALVDIVSGPAGTVAEHPGGSAANVAVALARLAVPVRLATWIGRDPRGLAIARWLADAGVALTPGSTAAARTPTAIATLDASGAATYEFDLEWHAALPVDEVADAAAVHTGSLAALLEPGAANVDALVEAARPHATISYDPNIRPALLGRRAEVRRRVERFVASADVVRASADDVAWLYPGDDTRAVAARWQTAGAALVVVTHGAEGAHAVCRAGAVDHPGRPVAVVDTVGAGDTFTAALLWGLAGRGLLGAASRPALRAIGLADVRALLAAAACAGELSVARAGADPPTLAELRAACGSLGG